MSIERIRECELIDMLIEVLNSKPCSLGIKSIDDLYKPLTKASIDRIVKLCNSDCECLEEKIKRSEAKKWIICYIAAFCKLCFKDDPECLQWIEKNCGKKRKQSPTS